MQRPDFGRALRIGAALLATLCISTNAPGQDPSVTPEAVRPPGVAQFRWIDVSMDVLFAVGSSTERDEELENLQGGGHDPRKRGFTVQNVELSLAAAVDPYFNAEAHIIYFLDPIEGETVVELEEAFATSQALSHGLQLEGGQFFTEFGRLNPQHPHQWHWQDQPVINTRLFGPDGMRGPGVRLGWLTPLPWFAELHGGVQNANGETMASFLANDEYFEERPIDGRPFVERDVRSFEELAWLARLDNGFDLTDSTSCKLGASVLYGPNATGEDGYTYIWGTDLTVKWRSERAQRGWPFVIWQSEISGRDYRADDALDEGADPVDPADDTFFPSQSLEDWGVYTQVLYGYAVDWAAGMRYEYASGSRSFTEDRTDDPFRDDRMRLSPLLMWLPTEFTRIRLQYNYDNVQHLEDASIHSVWIGFEFLFGAHPAHAY